MTEGWSAQHYSQRLKPGGMGDTAEAKFEEISDDGSYVRFGFNRPPFRMTHLSSVIRHTPDYVTREGNLVECMGMGRDGRLKLKQEKYDALLAWNGMQPVVLFVWNSHEQQHVSLSMRQVKSLVAKARNRYGIAYFNDGNAYWPIDWAWIEETE